MEALLGAKLLKGNEEVDTASLKGAVVALYFSAHWCPPCKAFTPAFKKVYDRCKEQGKSFDVVFVSSDQDETQFREYYREMPWHSLPYARRDLKETLGQRFGVRGIPAVVLLNSNGTVLDTNARSKVMDTSFLATLPRVLDVEDPLPDVEEPVIVRLLNRREECELEVEPEEGWELLRMQIFSITEVPAEQQRLFGLGTPTGQLSESVSLGQALARGIHEQACLNCKVAEVSEKARTAKACEWYQLDLGTSSQVAGVEIPPGRSKAELVTKFTVSTADSTEGPWSQVEGGRVFTGNVSLKEPPRRVLFAAAISARFVRIHAPQAGPSLAADVLLPSGEPQKPPLLVVLGNFSQSDPFEVAGSAPPENKMVQEQHLAFLQLKLSSAPERLQRECGSLQHVWKYEDLALQRQALDQMPVAKFAESVFNDPASIEGYELAFMRHLLTWFKHSFFTWTNSPKCEFCGSSDTKQIGGAKADQIEQSFGAGHVEVAQCNTCGQQTRFPRYNDPGKLLETRQGRCGEWANCFTLCCRALGFEARHVHDWTDHVWTEIYSDSLGRWLHADSCEAALDAPLVYEQGWGKKLTYCLAYGRDNVVDVTKRYTRKFPELLTRRKEFPEQALERVMSALDEFALGDGLGKLAAADAEARKTALSQRAEAEQKELAEPEQAPLKADEQVGRTSGDKEWREQRGELGANADARAKALKCSETGINSQGVKLDIQTTTSSIDSQEATDAPQVHQTLTVPDGFEYLQIRCRWKDQGWGLSKGRLIVVVKRAAENLCEHDCFGIADHEFEGKQISLPASELKNPRKGDIISIEYVVGGGGGHRLVVEDLKISVASGKASASTAAAGPSAAAAASGGYAACATPAAPAGLSKEDTQALVKKVFAELVAEGVAPNEAVARAIERAKKEQLQALTKAAFTELVASGMAPNDAAAKAVLKAREQMK